ncbi:MAG: NAD(P)H-hydrate dehydratase, partial [Propionibacteriaceae bacterium]|nr:NAD(P)H-hydrate dehydratase [Propionibacteriaceae bacterium]
HQAGLARLRVQAWVIGSGWGERPGLAARLSEAVATGQPVVIDADGLRVGLAGLPASAELEPAQVVGPLNPSVLLTPHAGELADGLGWARRQVEAEPVAAVRQLSDLTGATVLLKGATQYVARPGSATVHLAFPGPAWTAQAGSGDVLAGICGALLAAGLPAWRAGLVGASIQALAAVRHPGPYPPQALIRRLPAVIASLDEFGPSQPATGAALAESAEPEDGLWP